MIEEYVINLATQLHAKLTELAGPAGELVLEVARLRAANEVFSAGVFAGVSFGLFVFGRRILAVSVQRADDRYGDGYGEMFAACLLFNCSLIFAVVAASTTSLVGVVGMFRPELYLANEIFEAVKRG